MKLIAEIKIREILQFLFCSGKQFGRRHIRDTHERRHKGRQKNIHKCMRRFNICIQYKYLIQFADLAYMY